MCSPYNKKIQSVDMPARIARLPVTESGYPVPFFASWIDGKPDLRVVDPAKPVECHNNNRCWVCGEKLGAYKAFVIGPMCAVNRTSAEPPCHKECAEFSAKACPFLTRPSMSRNEKNLPDCHCDPAGHMIKRNPETCLVWVTKKYSIFRAGQGYLFDVGEPDNYQFYKEGRPATLDEVVESINSGLPFLISEAAKDGPASVVAANNAVKETLDMIRDKYAA